MSRLGRTLGLIVTLLTLPAAAAAQLPPGPPPLATGTGIIVGQVVDAATGKGVSSAVVTLAGSRRVMTTTDGRFAFRALPEGSHNLTAAKSGYIDGAFGMRRPGGPSLPIVLADAERRANLVIWLWRHGAITGHHRRRSGRTAHRYSGDGPAAIDSGGRRRFLPGGTGTTDDRGIYRIARLAPGDYAVAMATSQVSLPAATVKQFEETMLAGGDFNRNQVFQAMMQVGANAHPGRLGVQAGRRSGADPRTRCAHATTGRRRATLRVSQRLLSGGAVGLGGRDRDRRLGTGTDRHRPSRQTRGDGEGVGHCGGRFRIRSESPGAAAPARIGRPRAHRGCRRHHHRWRRWIHVSRRACRRLRPQDRSDSAASHAERARRRSSRSEPA